MAQFVAENDLRIGKIIEVNGTSIKVELDPKLNDLNRSFNGKVYSIGQMASIIKIHFGRKILFASVRMLRMSSEIDSNIEVEQKEIKQEDDSRILEADLLGQGSWNVKKEILNFTRGVELYPLPLQNVYIMTNDELDSLYKGAEQTAQDESVSPMVPIGSYVGSHQNCRANINKLFGNHCAVLGSTGSGKSGTVATILHSVLEHKVADDEKLHPRLIMIDPHGEYSKAFRDRAIVFQAYSEASSSESTETVEEIKLPYWLMTGDEFRSLVIGKTEHEATALNNIVYEALSYARAVYAGIIKRLGEDPIGGDSPELSEGKTEEDLLNFDRDKPIPFKLHDFIEHVDKVQGRKPGQTNKLAPSSSERKRVEDILKKVRILRSNPQLEFLLKELDDDTLPLYKIISQFIGSNNDEPNQDLRIIDISGLPNEVAGLLTALISRLIFQYKLWQNREEREKDPILLVCEEAHRYVPNFGEAQYKEAQSSIRRIAKEGRKYGIGLMLVSQRPSDVENTVLSQCNSWIVLRLTNASDQSYVANFIPDNLSGLTKILSSLTRREAIFVGEAAAIPSRIKIRKLQEQQLPDSLDINFVKGWSNSQLPIEDIKNITDKWTNQN